MARYGCGIALLAVLVALEGRAADPPHDPVFPDQREHWCATGTAGADEAEIARLDRWSRNRGGRIRVASDAAPASPGVRQVDGIYVVESDELTSPFDRPPDVAGLSLDFTRTGPTSFSLQRRPVVYDTDPGALRRTFNSFGSEAYTLTKFAFPFGSRNRSTLYIGSNKGIYFSAPPSNDALNQIGSLEAVTGHVPLIAPLLITARSYGGSGRAFEVYVKETAASLTITWKSLTPATWDEQVQAVLFSNGDVRFSYGVLPEDAFGAVILTTGEETFYETRQALVRATDAADDTSSDAKSKLTPAVNAMLDVVGLSVDRIGDSDLVEYRITTRAALDRALLAKNGFIDYYLRPGVRNVGNASRCMVRIYADKLLLTTPSWPSATGSSAVRIEGATIVISMLDEFLVTDSPASSVDAYTYWNNGTAFTFGDSVAAASMRRDPAPTHATTDLTDPAASVFTDRPIAEAFTLPVLNVAAVWEKVKSAVFLTDADADEVPIYQNFLTDLILYAGGFSTVGNPAADGIRATSSTYGTAAQRRPALLHLDKIGRGWNSTDLGMLHLLTHEFGHRWLYFFKIREGTTDTNSLNPDGAHPKKGAHLPAAFNTITATDASPMGGSYFTDQGGNRFSTYEKSVNYGYSWHELYLMGLAAPEEVTAPWFYLNGEGLEESYYPTAGRTYAVTAKTDVGFQQLLDAMGPRTPGYATSQKEFRTAFVIVERSARRISAAQVAEFRSRYADAFATHFSKITNGRGSVVPAVPTGRVRRRAAGK